VLHILNLKNIIKKLKNEKTFNNCLEKIKIAGIEHVIFLDKQK